MSREDVAVITLLVILIAVLWRKNVKAAASFLGLMSFTLEAKDPKPSRRRLSETVNANDGQRRFPE